MNVARSRGYLRLTRLALLALLLSIASCSDNGHAIDGSPSPCGPFGMELPTSEFHEYYLEWTPDGAQIAFNYAPASMPDGRENSKSAIWLVDVDNPRLRMVVDANPGYLLPYGFHADVSPDGTRIVYATCEFPSEGLRGYGENSERSAYRYEIAVINLDGAEQQRLTKNTYRDHYPVWSPDGSRIAFIANPSNPAALSRRGYWKSIVLNTMSVDGSDVRQAVVSVASALAYAPPVWSPNGQHMAFVSHYGSGDILFTVRADGSELMKIGTVENMTNLRRGDLSMVVLPTWSPDGERLAFALADVEGELGGIYTARPDGTDLLQVAEPLGNVSQVLWSPDGSEILVVADQELFLIQPDGSGLNAMELAIPATAWRIAAWSPDSTRIAFHDPFSTPLVYTVARDGTDLRSLVTVDDDGNLAPANPPEETQ